MGAICWAETMLNTYLLYWKDFTLFEYIFTLFEGLYFIWRTRSLSPPISQYPYIEKLALQILLSNIFEGKEIYVLTI